MDTRGIILTHQIKLSGGISGRIDPIELRKHLLYWDFIDFPTVNGLGSNLEAKADTKLLKEQGFILQTQVKVPSSIPQGTFKIPSDLREWRDILLMGQNMVYNYYVNKKIICS